MSDKKQKEIELTKHQLFQDELTESNNAYFINSQERQLTEYLQQQNKFIDQAYQQNTDHQQKTFLYTFSLTIIQCALTLKLFLSYVYREVLKRPSVFKISVFTIFLIVGFITILKCILPMSYIVFLKVAEISAGNADIILIPNSLVEQQIDRKELVFPKLINQTQLNQACERIKDDVVGCSMRWQIYSNVIIVDSSKEASLGVGRLQPQVTRLNNNSAIITQETYDNLDLSPLEENAWPITLNLDFYNQVLIAYGLFDDSYQIMEDKPIQVIVYEKYQREAQAHSFTFNNAFYNASYYNTRKQPVFNMTFINEYYQKINDLRKGQITREDHISIKLTEIFINKLKNIAQQYYQNDIIGIINFDGFSLNQTISDMMQDQDSSNPKIKIDLQKLQELCLFLLQLDSDIQQYLKYEDYIDLLDPANSFGLMSQELFEITRGLKQQYQYSDQIEMFRNVLKQLNSSLSQLSPFWTNDTSNISFNTSNLSNQVNSSAIVYLDDIIKSFVDLALESLQFEIGVVGVQKIQEPMGLFPSVIGNAIMIDYNFLTETIASKFDENLKFKANEAESFYSEQIQQQTQYLEQDKLIQLYLQSVIINSVVSEIEIDKNNSSNIDDNNNNSNIISKLLKLYNFKISEHAFTSNIVARNRLEMYQTDEQTHNQFTFLTNKLFKIINEYSFDLSPMNPLESLLKLLRMSQYFINNLFVTALFIIIGLSSLLMYSLIYSDVQERIYAFGMLRALGTKKAHLLYIIFLQNIMYAVPGTFFGIVMAFTAQTIIKFIFYDMMKQDFKEGFMMNRESMWYGLLLGLLLPFLASTGPARQALSQILRESLDVSNRSFSKEVRINIMKLEKLGISMSQMVFSIILIVMGIITYYLAPSAFMYKDIGLFLVIMNSVLFLLIIGITTLVNVFQHYIQYKIILKILVMFSTEGKKLQFVVKKNLEAHKSKNVLSTLLFTICLAFIIFIGTSCDLQQNQLLQLIRSNVGCDILLESSSDFSGLPEPNLRNYLNKYQIQNPTQIKSFSFISQYILFGNYRPTLSPLSGYPDQNIGILGIEENLFETMFSDTYISTAYDETINYTKLLDNGQRDGAEGLYSNQGIFHHTESNEYLQNGQRNSDLQSITSNRKLLMQNYTQNNILSPEQQYLAAQIIQAENQLSVIPLIISEDKRKSLSLDPSVNALIQFRDGHIKVRAQIRNVAKKMGCGFQFSSYPQLSKKWMFTSMPHFSYLEDLVFNKQNNLNNYEIQDINNLQSSLHWSNQLTYGVPKQKLLIRFNRTLAEKERMNLIDGLRNLINTRTTEIKDYEAQKFKLLSIFFYIDSFYVIVTCIALILAFFLIFVSFSSNINDHLREYGIFRAIGINQSQARQIYIYEALCLVISSVALGTTVGLAIAVTLTMQIMLFTEDRFYFKFPTALFVLISVVGIVIAYLVSHLIIKKIQKLSIADIIKGQILN